MKSNTKHSEYDIFRKISLLAKLFFLLLLIILCPFIFYGQNSLNFTKKPCHISRDVHEVLTPSSAIEELKPSKNITLHSNSIVQRNPTITSLHHIVFGIAASSNLWNHRKKYIKLWWRPNEMRGIIWLDKPVMNDDLDDHVLPPIKISSDTSRFKYENLEGYRSAIRISRIVSETLRLGMKDVRWFVMGDDDTMFVPDNLVRVLSKYDHNQYYYIGSTSETHLQNIRFSYAMAYGGGGFAVSYPLALALERIQDRCIQRYPNLYGSDDRIHVCMAELGVPLTKERGFHQFDVYGNIFGLLAAHPVTPLISLHHLDLVDPIFPNMGRVQALKLLQLPILLDSDAILQQSICHDRARRWTISVSWGYAVQIFQARFAPRDMEMPVRTFHDWYRTSTSTSYAFNTRPFYKNTCEEPFVYFLSKALFNHKKNQTVSEYVRNRAVNQNCKGKIANPSQIDRVEVYRTPDPNLWEKAPRRNCCKILPTKKKGILIVDVGACGENEVIEW